MLRAVLTYCDEAFSKLALPSPANALKSLADCLSDGNSDALTCPLASSRASRRVSSFLILRFIAICFPLNLFCERDGLPVGSHQSFALQHRDDIVELFNGAFAAALRV